MRDGANTQYMTGTSMLFYVYADILSKYNQKVKCGDKEFDHNAILAFGRKQVLVRVK